jgi:hypothetical protein
MEFQSRGAPHFHVYVSCEIPQISIHTRMRCGIVLLEVIAQITERLEHA